jgi:galactose mutarotase-like enzyme
MSVKIENDVLVVSIKKRGAELHSLKSKKTGIDYIYHTFPPMFCGSAPILFPIVGRVKNNKYIYDGHEYDMHIHGFVCFQKFEVYEKYDDKVTFLLSSQGRFVEIYPFEFELYVTYELVNNSLMVSYKVKNMSDKDMYFSIGSHPAFTCPIDGDKRNRYYLYFDGIDKLDRSKIDMSCGLLYDDKYIMELESIENSEKGLSGGVLPIADDLFAEDALVIENHQTHLVSLLMPDKTPYLSVKFEAPLFGIWSLGDRVAPFVCIEPWYGRCDKKDYEGELKDREWINILTSGNEFNSNYTIICDKES